MTSTTRFTLLAATLALAAAAPLGAHSGHARSKEIEISHRVVLSPGALEVRQTQVYTGKMAASLFGEVDADGNGTISAQEREAGLREGARQFTEAMGVLVDWLPAESTGVTATFLELPESRPVPGGPPLEAVTLVRATYRFHAAPGVRPFDLVIAQLNANRITGEIQAQGGLRLLKANCGQLAIDSVSEMLSQAGSPESFQVLFTESGAAGAPAAEGGVPPAAAAVAGLALFAAGIGVGRSKRGKTAACGAESDPAGRS
ncbi:MAG: hypothetical protein HY303_22130 [Candidatus Wallbacteria bacterium]|nr:hypothetical protein [Candidatus Wallbacteria bacterium]